jgi:transposase
LTLGIPAADRLWFKLRFGGVGVMSEGSRFVVSDAAWEKAAWEKIASLLPGKASDPGATARDNRLFLEAVLWRVRTGAPWRDLPSGFGRWNSVFQRFRRWVEGGVFERVFACLSDEPDFEYALIDGTIVTAHHKASGARGGPAIRPSAARAVA